MHPSVAAREGMCAVLQGFGEKDGEVFSVCQHCEQQQGDVRSDLRGAPSEDTGPV